MLGNASPELPGSLHLPLKELTGLISIVDKACTQSNLMPIYISYYVKNAGK